MERKRSVLAACGISVVLVVGSSAFAFANGVFVGKPEGGVGNFPAIQAKPVLAAAPASRADVTSAPPPASSAVKPSPDIAVPTRVRPTRPAALSYNGETSGPPRHVDESGEHDDEVGEHVEHEDAEHETAGRSERDD